MSGGFLWLAATTGILSLLTPCVFPMIPVTVAYFSNGTRRTAGRAALLFGLGIVATFTVLGLSLAALFGASGLNRFASDPRINLALALLFLVFAANLFGWFEVTLPWRLLTAADRVSREPTNRALGALVMGAVFTLTSVTCTAPFVGTLLVLAAKGSWLAPIAGMIVYSTAFALPFVLLALAPNAVAKLPRSGDWMGTLRVVFGLLEVAAAIKFIANADLVWGWGVFTRATVLALWAIIAIVGAVYVVFAPVRRGGGRQGFGSLAGAAASVAIALWLVTGIRGKALPQLEAFLPPRTPVANVASNGQAAEWLLNDYAGALSTARKSGKLVFVDFTGYTCTNCRWMEANIFSRPDVGAQLGQFVLARLYTDGEGAIYEQQQALQERTFGTVALPLYAIVGGDGKVKGTFTGLTRDPAEFIEFLRKSATGA
jgi:thiol:disulfide interchange protein